MSSDNAELKAGHPPAVKVGGMRVVTKHKHKEPDSDAFDEKYQDSSVYNPMGSPVKVDIKDISVAGGIKNQDKVNPASVKVAHDSHLPSKDKHNKKSPQVIHQPGRRS